MIAIVNYGSGNSAGISAAKLADEVFDRDKLANQLRMVIENVLKEVE